MEVTREAAEVNCQQIELKEFDEDYLILSKKLDSSDDREFFDAWLEYLKTYDMKEINWY